METKTPVTNTTRRRIDECCEPLCYNRETNSFVCPMGCEPEAEYLARQVADDGDYLSRTPATPSTTKA
jgi:hypothetical protein